MKYMVLNENTLCYRAPGARVLDVLGANVDGRDWKGGPYIAGRSDMLRPAVAEDFDRFRVKLPPDFHSATRA